MHLRADRLERCLLDSGQLRACDERQRPHGELHSVLGLKPWEWPAYQHPESVCPHPAGSHAAQHWKRDERGVELYRKLKEAAA